MGFHPYDTCETAMELRQEYWRNQEPWDCKKSTARGQPTHSFSGVGGKCYYCGITQQQVEAKVAKRNNQNKPS